MRLDLQHDYDCDTDTLLSLHTQRDYIRKKYEGLGRGPVEFIECGQDGGHFRTVLERDLPGIGSRDVPRIARRFVRESYTLALTEQWNLGDRPEKTGGLYIHIREAPVKMEGSLRLSPAQSGCVKVFNMEIKCSIPVVGRKVEQEAEKLLQRALEKECTFTRDYLQHYRENA